MLHSVSRRLFLAGVTGSFALRSYSWEEAAVPTTLDHILLGCDNLDRGIKFVEERTGIRAAYGGVHPGRGTRNALLSFGERHYLEIIAPDPNQSDLKQHSDIREMSTPRLIGWAVHPGDLNALAEKLRAARLAFAGPYPGSRKRPDGRVLNWKSLALADDRHGLLPFFIEWSADSIHPATDAPAGCRLQHFGIASPDPEQLSGFMRLIGIEAPVEPGEKAELRALIVGPKGDLEARS
jgi:hypothetical protein